MQAELKHITQEEGAKILKIIEDELSETNKIDGISNETRTSMIKSLNYCKQEINSLIEQVNKLGNHVNKYQNEVAFCHVHQDSVKFEDMFTHKICKNCMNNAENGWICSKCFEIVDRSFK